ncbi:MAG: Re/Si-specific NAD(P)(+) transhydrogenase subunit alpha [Deltaproteobacteria bacterium]|nr:Re/Si-specific NAD(P)(+) transhydrogenase subunit alpha [Deltaproteobacteria bacterium]
MILGVVRESFPGELRVALTPAAIAQLAPTKLEVWIEPGAGVPAGFSDAQYLEKGAKVADRATVLGTADLLLQVRSAGANNPAFRGDLALHKKGQIIIGSAEPLSEPEACRELAAAGVTLFAMELMPRITRAQSMDVLSSMATIAGYKAVLLAALRLSKIFPMLMTAAGTLHAAKVFVIGAGVAGLQAIATARRLGAVVEAYDVRPAVKEQVQSLGAKFVELGLETAGAEDKGGYARAQDEAFYQRQREVMTRVIAASDVVIATAAIPGKKAPILVTQQMVAAMRPGSVIVDLVAERGGNCELTKPGEDVITGGVTILGPLNLAASVPSDASLMYAKNLVTFVRTLFDKEGRLHLDPDDACVRETMVTKDGDLVLPKVRALLRD